MQAFLGRLHSGADNYLQAAFRSLPHLLTQDADVFTAVDRSLSYDRIEELRERYAAPRLRQNRRTFQIPRRTFQLRRRAR